MTTRISIFACFTLIAAALSGCPTGSSTGDGDEDAGGPGGDPNVIVCESRDDCPDPANWECQGVCLQLCASDDVCSADQFCDVGFCRTGCRAGTCSGDDICIAGACTPRANAETCGSKCDCVAGEICNDGICQGPPDDCNSSADCARGPDDICEAFACNGFTKQCFYPNAPDCVDDDECSVRPGCDQGCACAPSGLCISSAACTTDTEVADCGPGAFCTPDLTCDAVPECTADTQCETLGLVCNMLLGACERANPCAADAECTQAPSTYCNLQLQPARCAIPTCMNGGVTCAAEETCNPGTGACQPDVVGGDVCTSNAQCSNAPWPATEYCNVPFGDTEGSCVSGCQNNLSCPDGQNCNGNRECIDAGNNNQPGAAGSACGDIADCQAGLICHLFEGTCQETCGEAATPCDPATDTSCCQLSGGSQCNPGLILSFCAP